MTVTTQTGDARTSSLAAYSAAALAARTADAGAPVGVALAASAGDRPRSGAEIGVVVAALALPHLLGPVLAKRLDSGLDHRRVLATACVTYAAAMVGLVAGLDAHAPAVVLVLVASVAGLVGPLLTGGLSSRLAGVVPADPTAQERARGWDALTYGVAGLTGPVLVAATAAVADPTASLLVLAAAAATAGGLVLLLPRATPDVAGGAGMSVADVVRLLVRTVPLRRSALLTTSAALVQSAVAVCVVVAGGWRGVGGATLVAVLGAGNLVGSAWVTARPGKRPAEVRLVRSVVTQAAVWAVTALVPSGVVLVVAFALAGALNAPLFTAALALRSDHAPNGARAQVFVWSAGLKVGASALGSGLGGAAAGLGPRGVLLVGGTGLAAAASCVSRRWRTRRTA